MTLMDEATLVPYIHVHNTFPIIDKVLSEVKIITHFIRTLFSRRPDYFPLFEQFELFGCIYLNFNYGITYMVTELTIILK